MGSVCRSMARQMRALHKEAQRRGGRSVQAPWTLENGLTKADARMIKYLQADVTKEGPRRKKRKIQEKFLKTAPAIKNLRIKSEERLEARRRQHLDEQFAQMATDSNYQATAKRLANELFGSEAAPVDTEAKN